MHRAYDPHPEPSRQRIRWLAMLPWVVAIYIATGFYSVQPNERVVVRRCGKMLRDIRGPGLHFGFPYPIDKVSRLKTLESKRVGVRVSLSDRERGRISQPQQAECLTGDRNLILISAVVQFQISDPKAYLINAADVPGLVRNAVAGKLTSVTSAMNVDDILTVQRNAIQTEVRSAAQDVLDGYRSGVQITSISLAEGVAAPQEVAEAFRDVNSASADKARMIYAAGKYRDGLAIQAEGEAKRILIEAEGYAEETTLKAQGEADRFRKMAAELADSRELTVKRLILETMEEVLPRLNKVILDGNAREHLDLGIIQANE